MRKSILSLASLALVAAASAMAHAGPEVTSKLSTQQVSPEQFKRMPTEGSGFTKLGERPGPRGEMRHRGPPPDAEMRVPSSPETRAIEKRLNDNFVMLGALNKAGKPHEANRVKEQLREDFEALLTARKDAGARTGPPPGGHAGHGHPPSRDEPRGPAPRGSAPGPHDAPPPPGR